MRLVVEDSLGVVQNDELPTTHSRLRLGKICHAWTLEHEAVRIYDDDGHVLAMMDYTEPAPHLSTRCQ